ncbi:uncharacterized protein BJX67DRAFT_352704 [Aspergillus lucknowensis]|uniref:Uncharacterized protein n=1 Tax=Aspergillus lucknowensis TaxID=176173 RepID=A0ABR4LTB0_9EURO
MMVRQPFLSTATQEGPRVVVRWGVTVEPLDTLVYLRARTQVTWLPCEKLPMLQVPHWSNYRQRSIRSSSTTNSAVDDSILMPYKALNTVCGYPTQPHTIQLPPAFSSAPNLHASQGRRVLRKLIQLHTPSPDGRCHIQLCERKFMVLGVHRILRSDHDVSMRILGR